MREQYPHKDSINDTIRKIENSLHDKMMTIYHFGFEDGKSNVLNMIISEATSLKISYTDHDKDTYRRGVNDVLRIIDKYKEEIEEITPTVVNDGSDMLSAEEIDNLLQALAEREKEDKV